MQVVHERCCGLDVHKKNVVACVLTNEGKRVRTFGTVTRELLRLLDWLHVERITHVAMESTGVNWRPLYNMLEGHGIELMVVNPAHMKAVPGRKTDVKDAEWIADLLRHGLLRGSRIPERPQRELQEAVRYRRKLVDMRADQVCRLQKVLEGGNIKLGDVATDVMGLSGRDMLRGRRGRRQRSAGGVRPWQNAAQARSAGVGAGGVDRSAPALHAGSPAPAHRICGAADRATQCRDRGPDAAL